MIRLTRTDRRDLIKAHPGFQAVYGQRFILNGIADSLKLHAAFAQLYPSQFLSVEPLGAKKFALHYHDIGTAQSYCAALGEVGIACPEQLLAFDSPAQLAPFAARILAANIERMRLLGHCAISQVIGLVGQGVTHFYAPDRWPRADKEARWPEYARHNAEMAAYHHAYAEELFERPECPTSAYRYNIEMVEKYGGLRPELLA